MSALHDANVAGSDVTHGALQHHATRNLPLSRSPEGTSVPPVPWHALSEPNRLAAVRRLQTVIQHPRDAHLDRLTQLASTLLRTPLVVLSLLTTHCQEVVSSVGLPDPYAAERAIPLTHSICQYVVSSGAPLAIKDARRHPWIRSNRAVHELGVVTYAGVPVVVEGQAVGCFGVAGYGARTWSQDELRILSELAALASGLLDQYIHRATETALLEAQRDLAATLAVPDQPFHDVTYRLLSSIGERLGWDVVNLWVPDEDGASLYAAQVWSAQHMNTRVFAERLRSVRLRPGESIAGTVYTTRAPLWSADLSRIATSTRALFTPIVGVSSCFAFPALVGDDVVAIAACFSREHREEDSTLVDASATLGRYIAALFQRERALKALAASQARERSLVESSPAAMVIMGSDGIVRDWNPAAVRLFGYTRDQAVGRHMHSLIMPPQERKAHMSGLARYLDNGESRIMGQRMTVPALRMDGTRLLVEMVVARVPQDGAPLFMAHLWPAAPRECPDTQHAVPSTSDQAASLN